jgi:hypothetical protein
MKSGFPSLKQLNNQKKIEKIKPFNFVFSKFIYFGINSNEDFEIKSTAICKIFKLIKCMCCANKRDNNSKK